MSERGVCACGNLTSRRTVTRCAECLSEDQARQRRRRRASIRRLWLDGASVNDIARALNSTVASITAEMTLMRAAGWDLPYRNEAAAIANRKPERTPA